MKIVNILVGAAALASLPLATAGAGPCTTEIDNVTKLMAARDAGAGPTAGPGATTGQQQPQAQREHPPTAIIGEATEGKAASPEDVQSQTRGGPTAVEQSKGERRPAAKDLASAEAALEQARGFDRAGKETECMDAISRAKQNLR